MGPNSTESFRRAEAIPDYTPPVLGAPLLLYVAASHFAVSAVLVQEKLEGQAKNQVPLYFVSKVLSL
jgi:hypothetical protein